MSETPPVNRRLLWTVVIGVFTLAALAFYLNRGPERANDQPRNEQGPWVPLTSENELSPPSELTKRSGDASLSEED